jgi:actin related protein 2/3 complex subunit 5
MSNEYAFRKIDIDALDEDALRAEDLVEPDLRGPHGALADAQARSQETRNLVSRWVSRG